MGKPAWGHAHAARFEHIGSGGEPRELKHLSTARKGKDSVSSGERTRNSPNRSPDRGCRPHVVLTVRGSQRVWKVPPQRVKVP